MHLAKEYRVNACAQAGGSTGMNSEVACTAEVEYHCK